MQFAIISPKTIFIGVVLALPFVFANTIAVTGIAPMYSWLVELGPHIIFAVIVFGFIG